jgi:hypothetical protein
MIQSAHKSVDTEQNTSVFRGVWFCANRIKCSILRLRVALPIWRILYLDLYILTLKCTNFSFRWPYPESKMKPFPNISILLININPIDSRAPPQTNRVGNNID